MHCGFPIAAVLNLKNSFDEVPRVIILNICTKRLPSSMVGLLHPILSPMRYHTKGQVFPLHVYTTTGVPQGDPPSSTLFHFLMDEYLRHTNIIPAGTSSCVADDVTLLSTSLPALNHVLTLSNARGTAVPRAWPVPTSYDL